MYNDIAAPAAAGTLAATGIGFAGAGIWLLLASFALIAAGTALWRIVPRALNKTE